MHRTLRTRWIIAVALGGLIAAGCAQLENLPRLTEADLRFRPAQSSKIFSAGGELITSMHGVENRTVVQKLKTIPKHLQRAVIAIEDERYYEHDGVDFRAIIRAALRNASSGQIEEGGSTITQQYVKNSIIAPGEVADKTLERKIDEAALARQLEKALNKKEILRRYLNTVYFGKGAYGVQAAAKTFFSKPVWRLGVRESALLAGLIRSPESYDPIDHPKRALRRRNLVLRKMDDLGWLKPRDANVRKKDGLKLHVAADDSRYPAPYFVDYIQRLIQFDPRFEDLGKTWKDRQHSLFTGGLKIYTTVDLEMQAAAERAVDSVLTYPSDPYGSLVAIDPETGQIKAMVGGRDFFAPKKKDKFAKTNLAVAAEPGLAAKKQGGTAPGSGRQAGSAFKPFALVTAIEQGIPLSKVYKGGSSITFPGADNGGDYTVQNYEGASYSSMSLLEATVNSVNVVYAQLGLEIGPQSVVDNAEDMGIRTPLGAYLSAVLGTNSVNPLGMASGYGTLANNGEHHPPVAITRIEDPTGKVLYRDKSKSRVAVDPTAAYITTTALEQVISRGTAAASGPIGRPAAGKTGTAQEYRDAWFVGYTPDLVAAVWVGYPEGQIEMKTSCSVTFLGEREVCRPTRLQVTGGSWPTMIWHNFMVAALTGVPATDFTAPVGGGYVTVTIDTRTGCLTSTTTPLEFRSSATFTPSTVPTKSCPIAGEGVRVPDVVGFPAGEAARILTESGFAVTQAVEESSRYAPGRVVRQTPGAGSTAAEGGTVEIVVSTAPATSSVPSVLGMSRSAAQSTLQQAGFGASVITAKEGPNWKSNRGRVWKQSPSSGASGNNGSKVTIWVNPG
jgi:penicillin-binding protein 1A